MEIEDLGGIDKFWGRPHSMDASCTWMNVLAASNHPMNTEFQCLQCVWLCASNFGLQKLSQISALWPDMSQQLKSSSYWWISIIMTISINRPTFRVKLWRVHKVTSSEGHEIDICPCVKLTYHILWFVTWCLTHPIGWEHLNHCECLMTLVWTRETYKYSLGCQL